MKLRIAAVGLLAIMLLGSAAASLAQDRDDPRQREITIRLRDVSLRAALDILMRDTGLTYQLPRDIEADRVTVDLERLPLEQALHAILTAQGLTYSYLPDAKLYAIEAAPKPPASTEKVAPTLPPPPPANTTEPPTTVGPTPTGEKVTRVIPIRYGDAAEIARAFGGQVAQGRFLQGMYGYQPGLYGGLTPGYGPYGMRGAFFGGYSTPYLYGQRYGRGYGAYPSYGAYGGYGTGYGTGYGVGYGGYIPPEVMYSWPTMPYDPYSLR